MELELHVGAVVDKLRQDCIIIQDYTGTETPSAIRAEQATRRLAISIAILQSMGNPTNPVRRIIGRTIGTRIGLHSFSQS